MDRSTHVSRRSFVRGAGLAGVAALGFPAVLRAQAREIKVGHVHPLSGPLAFDGGLVVNGMTLAVEEINAAGGIKSQGGAKLTLSGGDSQGKPEVGTAEAERLIREGVVAVLGPYQSPVAYNISQLAEKEKTPFIITVAVADNITERGFEYTFRVQPNARVMTVKSLDHLAELAKATGTPVKTLAMMHEDGLFGTTVAGHVEKHAKNVGMELALRVPYSLRTADVTTEVTKIKAAKPDVVIVTGYFGDALLIARTATELRVETKAVMGISNGGFSNPKFLADQRELVRPDPGRQLLAQPAERAGQAGDGGVPEALQLADVLPLRPGVQRDDGPARRAGARRQRPTARRSARRWQRPTSPTTSCPRGRSSSTRPARTPTPSPPCSRTRAARPWSWAPRSSPRPRPSSPFLAGRADLRRAPAPPRLPGGAAGARGS